VAEIDTGLTVTVGGATSHVLGPSSDSVTLSLGAIACGTNDAPPAIAVVGFSETDVGVQGQGPGGGVVGTSDGADGIHGETKSNQHAGVSGINNSGGQAGRGGPGVYGSSSNLDGVQGWSQSSQNAGVSARNTAGGYGVWAQAKTAGYFEGDGNFAIQAVCASDVDAINVTSGSAHHAAVSATNNGGGFGVWANSPNGTALYGQGKVAGHFQGDVEVTGDIRLTGADCAEHFDVIDVSTCDPGTVMVIDDTGALTPSCQEYDRRVAGVVSGAGNLRPGLLLDQQAESNGRRPIALVGKVYCKADATYGPIEIGDLLTTSATPGHASRVTCPEKAFGAVIGKALLPLSEGRGLIPILIALQ
jgi:hypothetical protein